MSRTDGAIVAWHEVPGTASPQKSRPVGYGVIRAGVRIDSVWVLNPDIRERLWPYMGGIAKQNGMIPKCIDGVSDHVHLLVTLATRMAVAKAVQLTSGISYARSYRTLRDGSFEGRFPRHFVPGYDRCCPYGTRLQTFRNSI
jgi:hypothetical protein